MNPTLARLLRPILAGTLALTCAVASAAFPDRPVRIIVPFAAGGATDVIARTVAQEMSTKLGQPVIVENRAGANGNIGAGAAARAEADGYTLLMATSSHAINATLYKNLDYSLTKDFTGLSNLASVPLLLVVNPQVSASNASEMSDYVRANGDRVSYASGGTGTAAHLAGAQFNSVSKGSATHVPYKGGAPALNDLIGGQVQFMFANLPEVLSQVQAGRLKPIAVTGKQRHSALPDVPAFSETKFPEMNARSWFGLFVRAGTPPDVVTQLSDAITASVASPAVQSKLKDLGADPVGDGTAAFDPYVKQEVERWRDLVVASGASVE
ncbi:Bug family tripartite tricarboxylate transporter substrate binding protein [Bordetella sp. 02P26C-1]|uniref:Bug family tripartite tricarboxylate transporter substrate binding protein n=1 Tax=Bordetella sp. 02P26C-1 TaxID=2683195 RepID=UPI001355775C|nr:tripartite tricarboxylate transporter substrate binding protein [Bordetella sp. 02P26C-1]MVW77803.1 tripartite tricarboxylate transporter substrate binding protein [Bordetella sp. 02P26C-1]